MPVFFCPSCWAEIPDAAAVCPSCGADLAALDQEDFEKKLVRALSHPEPQTARRAAWILGRRRTRGAVHALLARYRAGVDPYLGVEIASALGRIGGPEAETALRQLASDPSFLIRRMALAAMEAEDWNGG